MTDLEAYVTLALVPGVGQARMGALLAAFGSAEAVLGARTQVLREVPGISPACATGIHTCRRDAGKRMLKQVALEGGSVLRPEDPAFPQSLREIPDAPVLLFAKGRVDLLNTVCIAIVGSRQHTRYGAEVCRHFGSGVARRGVTVVSGMARGLDAIAHTAALSVSGGTVGVLGNGFGVIYPSANRALYERVAAHGCLVTEYPPGERPNAGSFSRRNRLISGLSRATVVVEARERAGGLVTADCALKQGREVLAVPGPITSPVSQGCNGLIQSGAKPALGLRDLMEALRLPWDGDAPSVALPGGLTDAERQLATALSLGDEHVDEIAFRMGTTTPEVLAVLTSLEIRGLVEQLPGKVFRRTNHREAGSGKREAEKHPG